MALFSVVAWRLLNLTYGARTTPGQTCETFLSRSEWEALFCAIHRTSTPARTPPDPQSVVLWIAKLGGFLARRGDDAPGVKLL